MPNRPRINKSGPCFYCGRRAGQHDHKLPRSRGGSNASWNLVPACLGCNTQKGALSVEEFRLKLMIEDQRSQVIFHGEDPPKKPVRDFLFVASTNWRITIRRASWAALPFQREKA